MGGKNSGRKIKEIGDKPTPRMITGDDGNVMFEDVSDSLRWLNRKYDTDFSISAMYNVLRRKQRPRTRRTIRELVMIEFPQLLA